MYQKYKKPAIWNERWNEMERYMERWNEPATISLYYYRHHS